MATTCPKCNTDLPEQDGLEYRFCPSCGAEIAVSGTEIAEALQTIPPDLHHPVTQDHKRRPEPDSKESRPGPIPNQTIEPEIPQIRISRPQLVPPPGPPPASFFREGPPHTSSVLENPLEAQIQRPASPLKLLIIVIGVITILMGEILYLLLG